MIKDINVEETTGTLHEQGTAKNKSFWVYNWKSDKKVNKLYAKWKAYDNSFNSWINGIVI